MAKPGDPLPSGLMWRGNVIYVRVQVNGRREWASSHGASIRQAEQLRDTIRADAARGKLDKSIGRKGQTPTVSKLIDMYLPEWQGQRTWPDTHRAAEMWRDALGDVRADEVKPGDILKFLGKIQRERDLKPSSINRYTAFLRALYAKAIRDDLLESNPCRKVAKQEEIPRDRFLTFEEADRLQAVTSPAGWDSILIAIWTGVRIGKQVAIPLADVLLDDALLRLDVVANRKRVPRYVQLVGDGLEAVRRQVARAEAIGSPWLFPGPDPAKHVTIWGPSRMLTRACKRARIEGLTWHSLRHTTANWLNRAGIPDRTIQAILGHKTDSMTRRYTTVAEDAKREALNILAEYLSGSKSGSTQDDEREKR